jgi:hypothetical protein
VEAKPSLNVGIGGFEVKVSEFAQVTREFLGLSINKKARLALKAMIKEVDRDFKLVAGVMTPFLEINTPADFRSSWPRRFARFKNYYAVQWDALGTRCDIVSDQLEKLKDAHNWKRHVPLLGRNVKRLEKMGERWMANDQKLYEAMNAFIDSVDAALTAVNRLEKTPSKAVDALHKALQGTERRLLTIRSYGNELKRLSAQL